MAEIWNSLVVGTLEGALVGLFGFLGSYGLAIIVLTLAIKLVTYPLTLQQIRSTKAMRDVQPLIEEAKRRCGKDKEKLTQETMRIYRENGVNPAMGCLPMLIQMPIWFGLYGALMSLAHTSSEMAQQGFLWLPSLATPDPYFILVALTVVTQFVVQRMMTMPSTDPQQKTMNQVMMFMPLTFGFVAMNVPSGLALYWVTTNLFTFFQQLFTTGWGGLLPDRAAKAPSTAAQTQSPQRSASPNGAATAAVVSNSTSTVNATSTASKAARHKKRGGARPPKEEKRANGKR